MARYPLSLSLVLTTAACGVLPDDHALPDTLGRGSRRAIDSLSATVDTVFDSGRRIGQLTAGLAGIPADLGREIQGLQSAGSMLAETSSTRLQRLPAQTAGTVDAGVTDSAQRIRTLVAAPTRMELDLESQIGDLRRGLVAAPHSLGLEGLPLVAPTDPERSTEIVPSGRRWTWLERVLDRMAF